MRNAGDVRARGPLLNLVVGKPVLCRPQAGGGSAGGPVMEQLACCPTLRCHLLCVPAHLQALLRAQLCNACLSLPLCDAAAVCHPQGVDKLNELVAEAMREAHAKVGRGRLPLQLSPAVCCSPCVVQLVAFHLLVCSCSSNVRWQLACRPGGASPATLRAAQTRPAAHTPHSPADPAVITPCRAWTA